MLCSRKRIRPTAMLLNHLVNFTRDADALHAFKSRGFSGEVRLGVWRQSVTAPVPVSAVNETKSKLDRSMHGAYNQHSLEIGRSQIELPPQYLVQVILLILPSADIYPNRSI